MPDTLKFKKVLIANRGEIAIRVIRAVQELGMKAVCIYCEEDKLSLFKTKADEAYLIKTDKAPTDAYLNMKGIIDIALSHNVDAIHPGYGFLAENPEFAKMCQDEGIKFIGPDSDVIDLLGNKVNAKEAAIKAGVKVIEGGTCENVEEAQKIADGIGYPVMIKASAGGGGRGMRVCEDSKSLPSLFESAQREALLAFGDASVFIEKYIADPRHVEVQILADEHGNIVHLYERDCSIQRRHQKVVEYSPCLSISKATREKLCCDAVKLAKYVGYKNAGTVEFLFDNDDNYYFIEVNPRIQVEHTVTEQITGIDIVQSQILIAEGYELSSEEIGIRSQTDIISRGAAIECRITTEDVTNNFMPATGRIDVYKTGGGSGVRLDGGAGFTGSVISPYFDSLLVKATTYDSSFEKARRKMVRLLKETVIEGVKTNKDFLINVLEHDVFKEGKCHTTFIDNHQELFQLHVFDDREYKLIKYIAEKSIEDPSDSIHPDIVIDLPKLTSPAPNEGLKYVLDTYGPNKVVETIKNTNELLFTDTTLRDAHQSIEATRMRTADMMRIADHISNYEEGLFSLEMWGGATFDTSYRFLKESPWTRLKSLREKIPNVMFQMLLRASNAVGYTNYPDNLIREFIKRSADCGIDVFRIFDSLNWLDQMKVSCEEVLKQGKIAEVAICYTGDILDKSKTRYTLDYYLKKAKEVQAMGAHIFCIKDMSGLVKPQAAKILFSALKEELDIPVHFHTHDTSGNGVASILAASEAGVDIVDGSLSSMSGVTSQPSLNAVVAANDFTDRKSSLDSDKLQVLSDYFEKIRPIYTEFESGLKSGTTVVYKYEIPGGQYSNLKAQVESFGLGKRFSEVLDLYVQANELFGDIVKVTPSSKVVGDMAIFMLQNSLTKDNIYEKGKDLAFPDSVIDFFKGNIGQPEGGFDEKLRDIVLKGAPYITVRPGTLLEDVDFDAIRKFYKDTYDVTLTENSVTSAAIYPQVYEDYVKFLQEYGDFIEMPSSVFFHGLNIGEQFDMPTGKGNAKNVKLISISNPDFDGVRYATFEVNGFRREIEIIDKKAIKSGGSKKAKLADPDDPKQIGSPIPGTIVKINVSKGDSVEKGDVIGVVEAMKMETEILCTASGKVKSVNVEKGKIVVAKELICEIEE